MSTTIDSRIANAKLARNLSVKTVVWVRKPGPMADVAIRKAAPISGDVRLSRNFGSGVVLLLVMMTTVPVAVAAATGREPM